MNSAFHDCMVERMLFNPSDAMLENRGVNNSIRLKNVRTKK